MTAAAIDDAWMEKCIISISRLSGSDVQFAGLTETVDFDIGDKDIEGVPLVNGGRVTKWSPEADSTITFEAYPLQAATISGTTAQGFFDLMHDDTDSTVPLRVTNSHTRDKYRVLVVWTNDSSITTAHVATTDTYSALRIGMADGHFTSVKPSFTDGILKYTVMFKCAPYDKSANSNIMVESCAGTTASDVLSGVAAYTSSNKFS